MAFEVTNSNYKELIASGKAVVIDFWAEWCGPCRRISPLIDELYTEFEGKNITIGKCDVDANDEVAIEFKVRNIPTIVFIKDGQLVDKMVGASTKEAIKEKINSIL